MRYIIDGDLVLSRPPTGPLAAHISAFAHWAREQGYARYSRYRKILLATCFSAWLSRRAMKRGRVLSGDASRYLRARARRVRLHKEDAPALKQFLSFLRGKGAIPPEPTPPPRVTPVDDVIEAFEQYLQHERAVEPVTVVHYLPFIRQFLTDRFGHGRVRLSRLRARDITRFVQRQAAQLHLKRAKLMTTALRSFLQYARGRGDISLDLAAGIPPVANWSMPSIPRAISADAVRQLLASVDRRTATGRRDYAIPLLLARLGLRAREVAALELSDLDWAAGQITVQGKRGVRAMLPLPADAGAALAAYLRHGRPRHTSRRVFLRTRAPIGPMSAGAIGCVVRHTLRRADVVAPTTGTHQFRHGLATQMLRRGASLTEIGEIPPAGLLPYRPKRARPYLYSDAEIRALLRAARHMPCRYERGRLRPWVYSCLLGLLSVSGLRLGEARNLELGDVDLKAGVLTIRGAKFGKTRLVPLHSSMCRVLADYLDRRRRHWRQRPVSSYVFVSSWGNRLDSGDVHRTFYALSRQIGLRGHTDHRGPRIHDLRHRFAGKTLWQWYRTGEDPDRRLPILSAYLGHVHVADTYWYLSAWPELMHEAMRRLERRWEKRS